MKLETQLTIYGPRNLDFDYTNAGLRHDALVAHALVKAMEHLEKTKLHGSGVLVTTAALRERAAQLLAEWGVE